MVKTTEVLRKAIGEMKVVSGDVLSKVVEFVYIFDAQNCNPNGSLPENMPRQIPGTGQIYMTQESYKKRGKDLLREILEAKGLYEEMPQGKVDDKLTLWVSGRAVDPPTRFVEIVGDRVGKGKNIKADGDSIRYFLSAAVDAVSFGAVVPVSGNINLTGPIQIFDAVSVHPVEIIPEGGTGAFSTGGGQRTIRQEYKVGYALMVGGGVFLPGYVRGKVFSSESEEIKEISLSEIFSPEHVEVWIRAIWSGFATKYFSTSKNIRPIAMAVVEYDGMYVKHFIHRRVYEKLWGEWRDKTPGSLNDIKDSLKKALLELKRIGSNAYVWKPVFDMEEAEDGEALLLR